MKEISVFDVIGPRMIGPSSSHTAGALRIALLAGKLLGVPAVKARFILYGSFARTYQGHGTDRALVAGVLGFYPDDPRIRDAFRLAGEQGLAYDFSFDTENKELHPNTADIFLEGQSGESISVRGVSVGGGAISIQQINGMEVRLSGEYSTILIQHQDIAGMAAYITACLSRYEINIAFMRLYREKRGGKACTIIEADENIRPEVAALIENHPHVTSAVLVQL